MKLTWRASRSLVTLPLIYSATKKVLTIPLDAQAGTIAHDEMLFLFGTSATLVTSTRRFLLKGSRAGLAFQVPVTDAEHEARLILLPDYSMSF